MNKNLCAVARPQKHGKSADRLSEARLKKAWMAGANSGTEVAFELVFRSLEGLMKNLGVRRRLDLRNNIRSKGKKQ